MIKRNLKKYENDYESLPFEPILVEYRRKIVLDNLNNFEHKRVLEIGCGLKPIFDDFLDFFSITVVEPGELFYKNACKLQKKYPNRNINIINDYFENVSKDLVNCNFDFVIISCLLHELSDPQLFLKEVYKVCNRLTTIHINVPNSNSFHRVLAVHSGIIQNIFNISETQRKMQQASVYSINTLTELLINSNFRIVNEGSYFLKPFTHFQMQRLIDDKIIDEKILDGLFSMTNDLPGWGAEIFINVRIND